MKVTRSLLCVLLVFLFAVLVSPVKAVPSKDRNNKPYKVVCYHGSWSVYRQGYGKFGVEDIDPFLCTHLVYAFVGLGADNKLRVLDGYLDLEENWGKGNLKKFNALRNRNPHLTSIVSIGGWKEGGSNFAYMASDPYRRKIFVDSAVSFLLLHQFDGLDMNWQFPRDKPSYVALLQDLRKAFDVHGLLLTATVSRDTRNINAGYDIPRIAQLVDFVNLMSYDFHDVELQKAGHSSPLYPRPDQTDYRRDYNVDAAVRLWLSYGFPKNKLVVGVPTYGRTFTLENSNNNGLGATVTTTGLEGPYTRERGLLGYNEICEAQMREPWTIVWNQHHLVPYAYKGNQWVGYDDAQSMGFKMNYVKSQGLAGAMIWSIEMDDFHGVCGARYPLLSKINSVLFG